MERGRSRLRSQGLTRPERHPLRGRFILIVRVYLGRRQARGIQQRGGGVTTGGDCRRSERVAGRQVSPRGGRDV